MKHFEQLWEEAEQLSAQDVKSFNLISKLDQISGLIHSLEVDAIDPEIIFGEILFVLCQISSHYNINAYTALLQAMNDYKSSQLEAEENND